MKSIWRVFRQTLAHPESLSHLQQPGQIAYAIIDSKVADQFMPSVFPEIRAESVSSLAGEIDVPATALDETIAAFNESLVQGDYDPAVLDGCRTEGIDPPKSNWALPIDTPPFFAYPLRPGITFTYLGLKVDEQAKGPATDLALM